jgi:hypothetical protein
MRRGASLVFSAIVIACGGQQREDPGTGLDTDAALPVPDARGAVPDGVGADAAPACNVEGWPTTLRMTGAMGRRGQLADGDDIPMVVEASVPLWLILVSGDAGLTLTATAPAALPMLAAGSTVSVFLRRITRGYAGDHWFLAIKDPDSQNLLYAVHQRDPGMFDAGAFQTPELLGLVLGLREGCQTFLPQFTCTTQGADLTELTLEVDPGDGTGMATVRSGETRSVNAAGRAYNLWLGAAARVEVRDFGGCEAVPGDHVEFAIW